MASSKGDPRSVALLGVAVALAVQIPTTIQGIPDATVRAVVQVFTLLAVVVCSTLVKPRDVSTVIVNSLRPPARHDAPAEVDVDDRGRDTPRETPHGLRPKKGRK
jgi:hypothetical protein